MTARHLLVFAFALNGAFTIRDDTDLGESERAVGILDQAANDTLAGGSWVAQISENWVSADGCGGTIDKHTLHCSFSMQGNYKGENDTARTPWHVVPGSPGFCTTKSLPQPATKCVVKYFSEIERQMCLVSVPDGGWFRKFRDHLLHDGLGVMDTRPRTMKQNGASIFVMGMDDAIYAAHVESPGHFHHSTFLAGGDVKCAGSIKVHEGILVELSNDSGHYRPDAQCLSLVWAAIVQMGYNGHAPRMRDVASAKKGQVLGKHILAP